jgi:thiamine pyrophosphokinase
MSILIFANGDIGEPGWLRPLLSHADTVIAADGGIRHLLALHHLPDVLIGDMDSVPIAIREMLMRGEIQHITHPVAKNETDLELALLYAAEQFAGTIQIIGGLGGRLDQTVANILLLAHPQLQGRRVELVTEYETAWMVEHETSIEGEPGDTVSLIPLAGDAHISTTTSLQYPLLEDVLRFGLARGISNRLTAAVATVRLSAGKLLCVHTRQEWDR